MRVGDYRKRSSCRLCGSSLVQQILAMPDCPPVDHYLLPEQVIEPSKTYPMDLYMCADCGHAQLLDVVNPKILFQQYIYTSKSSPDLDLHFSEYAEAVVRRLDLTPKSFVVDIGSNDGLLLSKFAERGIKIQGVDPAEEIALGAIENGVPTEIAFMNDAVAERIKERHGLADVVCANNVFSHSDDLKQFAIAIRSLLKGDGVFIFEVSYLLDLVQNFVVDYIYHEHLAHHSVKPLKHFFESIGMKLFDVERKPVKGGSLRGYAALSTAKWPTAETIEQRITDEENLRLYSLDSYAELSDKIKTLAASSKAAIHDAVSGNGSVASYGASATSTVLNYMLDLNQYFSAIIDDNPIRQGRLSPGYHIPVISREALLESDTKVVFISAWRFAAMILHKNSAFIKSGGTFINPLPDFKIIKDG